MFEALSRFSPIISIVLLVAVVVLIVIVVRLEKRLKKILSGKKAADLEEVIIDMARAIDNLNNEHLETGKKIEILKGNLRQSVRHVKTIRFNPFPGEGGNQSFATAFLNDEGHGVVISGLYTRGQFNAYAKAVRARNSEHELSAEERRVLEPTI